MNKENTLYPSVLCAYINCSIKSGRCYYLPVLCCAVLCCAVKIVLLTAKPVYLRFDISIIEYQKCQNLSIILI